MALQTRYITGDDFLQYTGIDLGAKLKGNADPSDKVYIFLNQIEVRMEAFMNANFFKNIRDYWPIWNDYRKQEYKYALLEQALYVFRNGDISIDSGYEPDEGIKLDPETRKKITIAPNAIDHLINTGLWTRLIAYPSFFGPNGYGGLFF